MARMDFAPKVTPGDTPVVQTGEGGSRPTLALHDFVFGSITRQQAESCVEKWHYSRSLNGVKHSFLFGIVSPRLLGCAVFGPMATTSWKKYGASEADVIELRRLALSDECPKNSESRFIGWCIRSLRGTSAKVLVSYADPAHGHSGTIYRALGFDEVGKTNPDYGWEYEGRVYHSRAPRTKYRGKLKPFAARLDAAIAAGEAKMVPMPGKIIFIKRLSKSFPL